MTTSGERPDLDHQPATRPTRALALFCHGGTVASVQPPKERALSLARMRAIEQFVRASAAERGVGTYLLRGGNVGKMVVRLAPGPD